MSFSEQTPTESEVVFDLTRVGFINDIGRRMTLEAMRRLRLDGKTIYVRDPESVLPEPDMGDGVFAQQL